MRDPYLYEDTNVLINRLDIKEQDLLDEAEADYVVHIPLERNSQSATAERLSAPNGKFVVS